MNQEPSPLTQLANDFAIWRSNRLGRKAIPLALRQRAVDLRSSCRVSHIITALGINYSTLKRWSENPSGKSAPDFISLPPLPPNTDAPKITTDVLCELPNGIRLTLNSQSLNHTLLSTLTLLNTKIPS